MNDPGHNDTQARIIEVVPSLGLDPFPETQPGGPMRWTRLIAPLFACAVTLAAQPAARKTAMGISAVNR